MRRKGLAYFYAVVFAAVLLVIEIIVRVFVGFPHLYVEHPTAEYLPLPASSATYFGVEYTLNDWGMRSGPIEREKPDGVYRVLVLGDEVMFGPGVEQEDLPTRALEKKLSIGRRAEVLNVSAPGWGPGNLLAYVRKFGLFGADRVIWVARGSDLKDDREFGPLDPYAQPTSRALWYTGFYLGRLVSSPFEKSAASGDARGAAAALLDELTRSGVPTCLVLHPSATEAATGETGVDLTALSEIARQSRVSSVRGEGVGALARSLASCGS
ncbi:MAG: hypothetical protein AAF654_08355 [Myxococcota bacterium]